MSFKRMTILGCAALSVSCFLMSQAKAEEAAAAGEADVAQPNQELELEIRYIGELLNWGLSDFARDVMVATIARWPECEPRLFALEIRRLLLEGNFAEAEKRLNALLSSGQMSRSQFNALANQAKAFMKFIGLK